MKTTIATIVVAIAAGAAGAWAWNKYKKKGCKCAECQKKADAPITGANLSDGEVKTTIPVSKPAQPANLWVPPAGMGNSSDGTVLSADGFKRGASNWGW